MKNFCISLNDHEAEFYEDIAELANLPAEVVLQQTLWKTAEMMIDRICHSAYEKDTE